MVDPIHNILDRNLQTLYSTFPCQIPFMSSNVLLSECFQTYCYPSMSMTIRDSKMILMKIDIHISQYSRIFHCNFSQKMSKLIRSFTKGVVANLLIIFGTEENTSPQLQTLTKDSLLLKKLAKAFLWKAIYIIQIHCNCLKFKIQQSIRHHCTPLHCFVHTEQTMKCVRMHIMDRKERQVFP